VLGNRYVRMTLEAAVAVVDVVVCVVHDATVGHNQRVLGNRYVQMHVSDLLSTAVVSLCLPSPMPP
jgi:hypothetical protein